MLRGERFLIYLVLNVFLLWFKPLLRRFRIFDFMVSVYPGSKEDVLGYLPFEKLTNFIPALSAIGFVQKGEKTGRGLVVATKHSIDEVLNGKNQEFLDPTRKLANSLRIKKVALVGRLPHLLTRTDDELFATGKKGTVFTILESIRKIMKEKTLSYPKTKIGILGVGFIGGAVLRHLRVFGFNKVVGMDTRFRKSRVEDQGRVEIGPNPSLLRECDLVVVLSSQGDDVAESIPYLKQGVIVLDDTHPPISKENLLRIRSKGETFKVALGLKRVKFFPRLPNFEDRWLPGCVIEVLVESSNGGNGSQEEFNKTASSINFEVLSVQPKGES